MATQQASSSGVLRATEVLDLTIAQAHEAERNDLIQRLADARRLLVDFPVTAHLVGGSQQGKSSLMAALMGSVGVAGRNEVTIDLPAGQLTVIEAVTRMDTSSPAAGCGAIGRAHAVLFVSDASSELTRAEVEYLRTMQDSCPTIIFVLTKIDVNGQWRQVLERDKGSYSSLKARGRV